MLGIPLCIFFVQKIVWSLLSANNFHMSDSLLNTNFLCATVFLNTFDFVKFSNLSWISFVKQNQILKQKKGYHNLYHFCICQISVPCHSLNLTFYFLFFLKSHSLFKYYETCLILDFVFSQCQSVVLILYLTENIDTFDWLEQF